MDGLQKILQVEESKNNRGWGKEEEWGVKGESILFSSLKMNDTTQWSQSIVENVYQKILPLKKAKLCLKEEREEGKIYRFSDLPKCKN